MALQRNRCRFGEGVVGAGSCDCALARPSLSERTQFNTQILKINGQDDGLLSPMWSSLAQASRTFAFFSANFRARFSNFLFALF